MVRRFSRSRDAEAIDALAQQLEASRAELLASAARFRTLVQNSTDLTVVVNADHRLTFVSPASQSVLGLAESELEGSEVLDLVHPDDRARVEAALQNPAASETVVECRMRHADRTWRGVDVIVVDLRADATVGGVVLHIRDVTDRRRLEGSLRQAQKLESVGQLAAGVAHEINTPIQFISDNLEFLRNAFAELAPNIGDGAADLVKEIPLAIDEALDGCTRVATIVRAMKAFSHPSTDSKAPVDLNEAIRNTLVVAHSEVKYVAEVSLDCGDLPPVMCHAGDVNQVLLNLIVNAAHAIAPITRRTQKKGRISIRTRVDGPDAVVEVADTGPGIPPEIADRVFEPFFTTKDVGVGTGQGLALVYSVIHDRHQGTLSFETDPILGTVFTVRIPVNGVAA